MCDRWGIPSYRILLNMIEPETLELWKVYFSEQGETDGMMNPADFLRAKRGPFN